MTAITARIAIDRRSIVRDAWERAYRAAIEAKTAVRQHLSAAFREAWARWKEDVASGSSRISRSESWEERYGRMDRAMARQKLAGILAEAKAALMTPAAKPAEESTWTVFRDHHASAVISHTVVDGLPILVTTGGGRYPSLVDQNGRTTRDATHVQIWVHEGKARVVAFDRSPDENGVVKEIYVSRGNTQDEAVAEAMAHVGEAVAAARSIRAEKAAHDAAVSPVHEYKGSMTRVEYEAACARFGIEPMTEEQVSINADPVWPEHTVAECIGFILAGRRVWWREHVAYEERRAAEKAEFAARRVLLTTLRAQPVTRTVSQVVPGFVMDEILVRNTLWTVIERGPAFKLTEDDPSIHGSHLLGHEGETARKVTFELRVLPTA